VLLFDFIPFPAARKWQQTIYQEGKDSTQPIQRLCSLILIISVIHDVIVCSASTVTDAVHLGVVGDMLVT